MPEIVKSGRFLMFTLKLSAAQQSVQQSAIMALLRCTSLAKLLPSASRAFSATAGNPFGDAGKGAEEVYFNKEERRALQSLLKKVQAQSEDKAAVRTAELKALKAIVDKYNVSAADLDKLLAWKAQH